MNDQEKKIKDLEDALKKISEEQSNAARLLIRRDLALSRANEQLKVLDVAKSEFISVAAHQLRTPLTAVKWILYMLLKNEFKSNEERSEFTEKAAKSADRMIELVNDLLEVDHIQSGKDQFVFGPVNIQAMVLSLVAEFKALIDNKKIEVKTEFKTNENINGDARKLRALFQNLIENAIKYTPQGGLVQVLLSVDGPFVKAEIKDTGIGIPDDQKYRIFSKFFRASNAMKLETVGSGLGLFIAKEVVERHGGKIWFESKVGEGTVFSIELPIFTETAG